MLTLLAAAALSAPAGDGHHHPPVLHPMHSSHDGPVPSWANDLAHRLGIDNAATLLTDWQSDRAKFAVNVTTQVVRRHSAAAGVSSVAVLPQPLAPTMTRTNLSIGILQMQSVHGQTNESMGKASALLESGPQDHTDLLVLPELALTGYVWDSVDDAHAVAEPANGPTYGWASSVAQQRNSHVLVGFVELGEGDTMYNSAMLVSPAGELIGIARKTALTELDAQWAQSGSGSKSMPVMDLPFGRLGVGICKDMSAVPAGAAAGEHSMDESFRMADVDVIVVLAAWDSKDKQEVVHNKWKARVGKHLGTNTLLVIADQVGQEAGVPFAGSSAVMDLAGPTTLGALSETEEGVLVQHIMEYPLKQRSEL